MSDTDVTGASGASESGGGDTAQATIKDQALTAMAKSDDTTDYINERREREAEEAGTSEPETPQRKQARKERFQRALEAARSADVPGDASQHHNDGATSEADSDDRQRELAQTRHAAQFEMRAADFERSTPDYRETIQATFTLFPPAEHVAEALLASPVGPQLSYLFANNIEAIDEINAMSPAQARVELAKVEGALIERMRTQGQAAAPPRRTTKAPRPLSTPRGGASPPRSVHDAAKSDDATDYVRMRRSQDR